MIEPETWLLPAGIKVTPMTNEDMRDVIAQHVAARRQCVVASLNLHALHVLMDDSYMKELHHRAQTFVHIDGMPIVLLCRLFGFAAGRRHRVTCLDYIWPLLESANRGAWRVYYLGGTDETLQRGLAAIRTREPQLCISGHDGYFDCASGSEESHEILRQIREFRPSLILVGMGMGIQERWILENLQGLPEVPVCTVGALMEYLAGHCGTPPRWMGRLGMEWLYRLLDNPSRFWRRYLIEPWFVVKLLFKLRAG